MEGKKANPVKRVFRKMVEARWFYAFSASATATIVGISLTFGINSCRERQRAAKEIRKSMVQAVDNLSERLEDAGRWLDIILSENRIYEQADSICRAGEEPGDSLLMEFYNAVPYIRVASYDHEFEKIFRGSYQIWQLQNSSDSLTYYISQCYDDLNIVETTCQSLTDEMIREVGEINKTKDFFRAEPREWAMTLLRDPQFQYFMSVRMVKADVATQILESAESDYRDKILPSIKGMRYE